MLSLQVLPGQSLSDVQAFADVPATQRMQQFNGTWSFTRGKDKKTHNGFFAAYAPKSWDQKSVLPLLIFYHGAGGRVKMNKSLEKSFYLEHLIKEIRHGKEIHALVLCPQAFDYWGQDAATFFTQALAYYKDVYDPKRVYVTGLSSGGGGTWVCLQKHHQQIAAAVPICGIRKPAKQSSVLVQTPIWAFHNKYDPYQSVVYTRAHVEEIKKAGGKYIFYTEYESRPGKSHKGKEGEDVFPKCHAQAWEAAYGDPDVWAWLFKQRLGKPDLALKP